MLQNSALAQQGGKAGEMANAICDSRNHPLDAWGIGCACTKGGLYNVRAGKKTKVKMVQYGKYYIHS